MIISELDTLIDLVIKENASDLHLSEDRVPLLRIGGQLVPLSKHEKLSRPIMEKILDGLLSPMKKKSFETIQSADFAYTYKTERFRSHLFLDRQKICIAFRHIAKKVPTLSELNLPDALASFAHLKSGFFLVVGPTGHGKSTTLASLVQMINEERLENIITIEDPIEYIFVPQKSVIHQREVGTDTPSFASALHDSFRADVNVIMVGEMRDQDTISTAVTAAETGHLVFSTLHTNTAAQTIERIIDSFPSHQQNQIRIQLASSLSGIFSQRLVPKISGGLVPIFEL